MFNIFNGNKDIDHDEIISIPLLDTFKVEGEYLKRKRKEMIKNDTDKRLLINNPSRTDISLYNNIVLK